MKITFEFDTESEHFDRTELQRHYQADKLAYTLNDIINHIRNWYKYDSRGSIPADEIYDSIWDIIQDNNINMEDLGY